jgi:hypothetical protein
MFMSICKFIEIMLSFVGIQVFIPANKWKNKNYPIYNSVNGLLDLLDMLHIDVYGDDAPYIDIDRFIRRNYFRPEYGNGKTKSS